MNDTEQKNVKSLKQEFYINKIYKMVIRKRNDKFCWYDVSFKENKLIGFEIHKIRLSKIRNFENNLWTPELGFYERISSDKEFGMYGWYFTKNEVERAEAKWKNLTEKTK